MDPFMVKKVSGDTTYSPRSFGESSLWLHCLLLMGLKPDENRAVFTKKPVQKVIAFGRKPNLVTVAKAVFNGFC
jgi:hypothetical protein